MEWRETTRGGLGRNRFTGQRRTSSWSRWSSIGGGKGLVSEGERPGGFEWAALAALAAGALWLVGNQSGRGGGGSGVVRRGIIGPSVDRGPWEWRRGGAGERRRRRRRGPAATWLLVRQACVPWATGKRHSGACELVVVTAKSARRLAPDMSRYKLCAVDTSRRRAIGQGGCTIRILQCVSTRARSQPAHKSPMPPPASRARHSMNAMTHHTRHDGSSRRLLSPRAVSIGARERHGWPAAARPGALRAV